MKQIFRVSHVFTVLAMLALLGCGGGESYELAPVKGKVTCQDKPVPGGTVTLIPIAEEGSTERAAPPAAGRVDENGNFELMTGGELGAAIGKHRVVFAFPEVEKGGGDEEEAKEIAAEQELAKKLAKLPCRRVDNTEFTVAAGDNNLTVELATGRAED